MNLENKGALPTEVT